MRYIANRYDTFYGKINEVVRKALEEFLDRHEGVDKELSKPEVPEEA